MMEWTGAVKLFVELFAVIDPVGAVFFFVMFTRNLSPREKSRTAYMAPAAMALTLILAFFFGERLLWLFGISIYAFMAGGGILILLTAIAMMGAYAPLLKSTAAEEREAEESQNVAVVPLAVPLLAGPGAITAVIIARHAAQGWAEAGILVAIITGIAVITLLLFTGAERIATLLGRTGMNIFTRLLGLVLTSYAVEIIAAGIKGLFPR
ncbi:MAG: NAAT family transporter [Nitrospinae bacterium]|nr:NAAT family transporter [Nitrospinota bacterium]